jgi:hypothetical protein
VSPVILSLRGEDAKPILEQAARDAAYYGGWLDHITRRTWNSPQGMSETFEEARARWQKKFLAAKRIVEAFGVEIESTSEEETLTVEFPHVGGKKKLVKIGGIAFNEVTGSKPDYKDPRPRYRGAVHLEAAWAAASRVVRAWERLLSERKAA